MSKVSVQETSIFTNKIEHTLMDVEADVLVSVMGEIMELKIYMEDYENMLRCVFKFSMEVLDRNKKISMDITSLVS